ncbi:MAG: outer membrane lipoprotein-sorting protein [Deltaproteobacteria bacterium]|nr:outer membrane lipoprotein-sorting protein [Deltaproteobacteria bacterium]
MRTLTVLSTLIVFLATTQNALAADPTPVQIMEKAVKAIKLDGAESIATLIIFDAKGNKRVRKTASVSKLYDKGLTEKRLIRFLTPADVKGTGLLTFDYENKTDDMWLYLPALRKTRRIVASEKAKSFMGSEFSYADITPPKVEDFTHKIIKTEKAGGVSCWVIESIPKSEDIAEENGFSKKVSHIGKPDFMIRKSIYYDLDDELHKELTTLKVEEVDKEKHLFRPMHMEMLNKQNKRRSVMKIEKFKLRPDVPDEYFTTRYLER